MCKTTKKTPKPLSKPLNDKEQAGLSLIVAGRLISEAVTQLQCLDEDYDYTDIDSEYDELGTASLAEKIESMWNRGGSKDSVDGCAESLLDVKDIICEHGEQLIEEESNGRDFGEIEKMALRMAHHKKW